MTSGSIEGNERELTVEEASDALNVSVAYVAALLDVAPSRRLSPLHELQLASVRTFHATAKDLGNLSIGRSHPRGVAAQRGRTAAGVPKPSSDSSQVDAGRE